MSLPTVICYLVYQSCFNCVFVFCSTCGGDLHLRYTLTPTLRLSVEDRRPLFLVESVPLCMKVGHLHMSTFLLSLYSRPSCQVAPRRGGDPYRRLHVRRPRHPSILRHLLGLAGVVEVPHAPVCFHQLRVRHASGIPRAPS